MAAKARFIKMLIKSGAVESRNGKLVTIDKAKADKVKAQYEAIIKKGQTRTKAKPKTATYKPKGWADNKMQTKAKGTTYKPKGWANQMTTKAKPTTAPKAKTPTKAKPTPMPKSIVDPVGLYPSNYPQKMKEYEGIITKYEKAVKGGLSPAVEKKAKDKISKYKELLKYQKSDKSRIKKAYVLLEIEKAKTKTPTTAPKKRAATVKKKIASKPFVRKVVNVSDTQKQAIQDVLTLKRYEKVGKMVAGMVFSKWKDQIDKKEPIANLGNFQKTILQAEEERKGGLLEYDFFKLKGYYVLSNFGIGFVNSVNERRKGLKQITTGSDLFEIADKVKKPRATKAKPKTATATKAKPTTAPKKRAATVKKKIASKPIVKTTKAKALENIYSKDKIFKGKNFYFNNGRIFDLESIGGDLMIDQDNTAYYLKYPVKYYALNANKVSEKDFMILDDYKTKLDKSPKTSMYNYVLTELSKKHNLNATALMKMTANRPNFNNNKADFDSKIQSLVSRVGVKLTVAEKKKAYELYIIEKFKNRDFEYFQTEIEVIKRVLDYSKTATKAKPKTATKAKAKPTAAPKKKSITPKIGSFGSFYLDTYENGKLVFKQGRKKIQGKGTLYGREFLIVKIRFGISDAYEAYIEGYPVSHGGRKANNAEELKDRMKEVVERSNKENGAVKAKKFFNDAFKKLEIYVSENLK